MEIKMFSTRTSEQQKWQTVEQTGRPRCIHANDMGHDIAKGNPGILPF
jgi:hypothetical protein